MPVYREGMRVRLKHGMPMDEVESDPYKGRRYDFNEWAAGQVPVGTLGTVCLARITNTRKMVCVNWDGITPEPTHFFGYTGNIGDPIADELEEVQEGEPHAVQNG